MVIRPDAQMSTFSIVARDPANGDLGIIVQSKFPCVGSVVPWAKAGVGAIAIQAWANVSYGPRGLELLEDGLTATQTLEDLLKHDEGFQHRQVGIVDADGHVAVHTGDACMEWAGHVTGKGFSCQGNILAGETVVVDMAATFEMTEGDLLDKLIAALKAGQAAGGDKRGMQSAALFVVRKEGGYEGGNDRYVDVRVDEHPSPIEELERIFKIYDMTLLSREAPTSLIEISGPVAEQLQLILRDLGYLDAAQVKDAWHSTALHALKEWTNTENFENKAHVYEDGQIWKSVLEYITEQWRKKNSSASF